MPQLRTLDVPPSRHAEGPVYDAASDTLYWLDLSAGIVHRRGPGGTVHSDRYPLEITAIAPHTAGGLIAATADGFAHLERGTLTPLADMLADDPTIRMNDGGVDPVGRFLAGSMAYDARPQAGALYVLDLDGTVRTLLEDVTIANGIDWSPDGATCYFTDSGTRTITAYRYDTQTAELSEPRVVVQLTDEEGEPDGLTVDAEGTIWTAIWDGWQLRRYGPDGTLLASVHLPARRPTSPVFAGPRLADLYVTVSREGLAEHEIRQQTAAGRLITLRPRAAGKPSPPCRVALPAPSAETS